MMKRNLTYLSFLLVFLVSVSACKKDLEGKFFNPEKSDEPGIPGLFTYMENNDRVAAKYWNVRTFLSLMPGVYSQTVYIPNAETVYQQNDGYSGEYWQNFYAPEGNGSGVMASYKTMQVTYAKLSEQEKTPMDIFMQAGKIVLIEQAAKMVDMWGDIPYSQTASLNESGTIVRPKYDDQVQLYKQFIDDLTAGASYFKTAQTSPDFSRYDILLRGNVKKWERYANSLKLRLLMHTSFVDEVNARTAVQNMLNNPADFPLIDGGNAPGYNPGTDDVLLAPASNNQADLNAAYQEGSWYAPDYMVNTAMAPSADPRLRVYYEKYGRTTNNVFKPNLTFKAMPNTLTSTEQQNNFPDYAVVDSATFAQNKNLPGFLITASEVNFLKAEAQERWGSSALAQSLYDLAIRQSITFYFYLNGSSSSPRREEAPVENEIVAFLGTPYVAYKSSGTLEQKLEQIASQKWIHFNLLQSIEAWTEIRRTGYPKLVFPSDGKMSGFSTPPNRLIYPSTERNLNRENWEAVSAKDTRDAKVFWDVK